MAAIVVEDLRITYADLVAVDGLSFDAAPGEIVALLGPNGAGKTSTVEAIEGFRRPASGTIRVLGLDPIADHAALVPRIGVMLQDGGVATGIMNAIEAPTATGTASMRGSSSRPTATAPRIGRKVAVEAVLEVISVR